MIAAVCVRKGVQRVQWIVFLEINTVPDVLSEMLQRPSPTVHVPTVAAALSPALAQTFTFLESPTVSATDFFSVPTAL